jgi:hypothetical protein
MGKLACGQFSDISFACGGERRDFRRLRHRQISAASFRASASFAAAKGATFAACGGR